MENKKGTTFAFGILIIAIAVTVYAIYAGVVFRGEIADEVLSPLTLLAIQSEAREAQFYLEESTRLASDQSIFKLAENPPTEGRCSVSGIYGRVFDSKCTLAPKNEFEAEFLSRFEMYLKDSVGKYETTWSSNDLLYIPPTSLSKVVTGKAESGFDIKLSEEVLTVTPKKSLEYSLPKFQYSSNSPISVELPFSLSEFYSLYGEGKKSMGQCKKERDVYACVISSLDSEKFKSFNVVVNKDGDFIIFEASSKRKVFFTDGVDKFGELKFNFAFSIRDS